MPIVASEIRFYKSSSGVGLGGPISATEILTGQLNNLFDNVSSQEAASGDIEYRCFYVKNTNASLVLLQAALWINSNTASPDTQIEVGIDPGGVNSSAQIVANEAIAPTGVAFSTAIDMLNAIPLGNIPANGGYVAVWVKREVTAGAAAASNDFATLTVQGETTA